MIARVIAAVSPAALWARLGRWCEVQWLRAELAGLDEDLTTIRAMKLADSKIERDIMDEIRTKQRALRKALNKGGV